MLQAYSLEDPRLAEPIEFASPSRTAKRQHLPGIRFVFDPAPTESLLTQSWGSLPTIYAPLIYDSSTRFVHLTGADDRFWTSDDIVILELGGEANTGVVASSREPAKSIQRSAAAELRELTSLSAAELSALFPVSRETFQRWTSGALMPSTSNLERLLALKHLFQEVRRRVGSTKEWLLTPAASEDGVYRTPYEVLRGGELGTAWDMLLRHHVSQDKHRIVGTDGTPLTRFEHSLRTADRRSAEEEVSGYDDLFDGD